MQHIKKVFCLAFKSLLCISSTLVCFCFSSLQAQTMLTVESIGNDKQTAMNKAIRKLSFMASQTLIREKNLKTDLVSALGELIEAGGMLPGAIPIVTEDQESGKTRVTISMRENRVVDAIAQTIDELKIKAKDLMRRDLHNLALTSYYNAFLRAFFIGKQDAVKELRKEIKKILYSPEFVFNVKAPVVSKEEKNLIVIQVPLEITLAKNKVSNLWIQLLYPGISPKIVQGGKAAFSLYSEVIQKKKTFKTVYGPTINADVPRTQLGYLYSRMPEVVISDTTEIEINFLSVVKIDFETRQANDTTYFSVKTKNVSLSDKVPATWSFGDGDTAIGLNVKHFYRRRGEYSVVMKINGLEDFVRVKDIEINSSHKYEVLRDSVEYVSERLVRLNMNKEREDKIITMLIKKINQSSNDFLEALEDFRFKGELLFGRKGDFDDLKECYIFLVNKETKRLSAVLGKGERERWNRVTNERIKNPKQFLSRYKDNYKVFIQIR